MARYSKSDRELCSTVTFAPRPAADSVFVLGSVCVMPIGVRCLEGGRVMKLRIAIWAGAGALVVVFWSLYISAMLPAAHGTMWTLACLTCPVALARHHALNFYSVLVANAATYALVGLTAEALRGHVQRIRVA
jgi:hypothetical protein